MARGGRLPENTRYRDTGCDVSPSCLVCPLPVCRYDLPYGIRAFKVVHHTLRVMELTREGHSRREIAQDVGVTVRTVSRIRELAR